MENQKVTICLIILIVCLAVSIYLIYPQAMNAVTLYQDIQAKTQSVQNLKSEIEDLKRKKEQHERQVKTSTKPVYKNELEITDQMSSFGVMFEDVIQAAKYNGLKLRSISYELTPVNDEVYKNVAEEYNACSIKMQLIGNYSQFNSYFQDIYNYPYLISLDKINIKPYEKNKQILIANISVNIYSSKNEAQIAAYKEAKAAEATLNAGDKAVGGGLGAR